jgi:hypothetical protein
MRESWLAQYAVYNANHDRIENVLRGEIVRLERSWTALGTSDLAQFFCLFNRRHRYALPSAPSHGKSRLTIDGRT